MSMVATINKADLAAYAMALGDDSLILGQRLSEWCGHAPQLELDMTLSNLALDLIGQARLFLNYAGEVEGEGRSEDQLAFLRDVLDYKNLLLVEQPNGDFAATIARQFLFSSYQELMLADLSLSRDEILADIAAKARKEVAYHAKFARDWMVRLGDGTEESHTRMQRAIDDHWRFIAELFQMDEGHKRLLEAGVAVDLAQLHPRFDAHVNGVLEEATLTRPEDPRPITGGRQGQHSEHLGHLLSEMQFLQRAYPGAEW